jgi:hypothetical protein
MPGSDFVGFLLVDISPELDEERVTEEIGTRREARNRNKKQQTSPPRERHRQVTAAGSPLKPTPTPMLLLRATHLTSPHRFYQNTHYRQLISFDGTNGRSAVVGWRADDGLLLPEDGYTGLWYPGLRMVLSPFNWN